MRFGQHKHSQHDVPPHSDRQCIIYRTQIDRLTMHYVSIALLCYVVSISSAFQPVPSSIIIQPPSNNNNIKLHYSLNTAVDIAESAPRQIEPLTSWASNYGVQISDCYQLNSDDGLDVYASTNQYLPMGSQILGIPNELVLTGNKAREELGSGVSYEAEQTINPDDLSAFYLFLKVLKEYDLGEDSLWFSWLNSLPRYYSNGASLTDFCFGCLVSRKLSLLFLVHLYVHKLTLIASLTAALRCRTCFTREVKAREICKCTEWGIIPE